MQFPVMLNVPDDVFIIALPAVDPAEQFPTMLAVAGEGLENDKTFMFAVADL